MDGVWASCVTIVLFMSNMRKMKMNDMILKIIGVQMYNGLSRSGKPFMISTLEVEYNDEKCKIKTFLENAKPGDFAQIVIGTRNTIYGKELTAIVKRIIPAKELKDNWIA